MSEPIKPGDLVMVVRPCCTAYCDGRPLFIVNKIYNHSWRARCGHCKKEGPTGLYAGETSREIGVPLQWLKRIPPLSELEGEKRDERIEA